MFPRKLDDFQLLEEADYDNPLAEPCEINEDQLQQHLARLSAYKALGVDSIPNVILKKGADYIIPYLLQIYRAALSLGLYPTPWSEILTCVLRKPGKSRYDMPKSYGRLH